MRERPSDQRRDTWCRVRQARQQQPCRVTACAVDMMKSTCAWNEEGRRLSSPKTYQQEGHSRWKRTPCRCNHKLLPRHLWLRSVRPVTPGRRRQKQHRTHTQALPRHRMPSISSKGAGT
jgi:hypothetical protein